MTSPSNSTKAFFTWEAIHCLFAGCWCKRRHPVLFDHPRCRRWTNAELGCIVKHIGSFLQPM